MPNKTSNDAIYKKETRTLTDANGNDRIVSLPQIYWGSYDFLLRETLLDMHGILAICDEEAAILGVGFYEYLPDGLSHMDHHFQKNPHLWNSAKGKVAGQIGPVSTGMIDDLEKSKNNLTAATNPFDFPTTPTMTTKSLYTFLLTLTAAVFFTGCDYGGFSYTNLSEESLVTFKGLSGKYSRDHTEKEKNRGSVNGEPISWNYYDIFINRVGKYDKDTKELLTTNQYAVTDIHLPNGYTRISDIQEAQFAGFFSIHKVAERVFFLSFKVMDMPNPAIPGELNNINRVTTREPFFFLKMEVFGKNASKLKMYLVRREWVLENVAIFDLKFDDNLGIVGDAENIEKLLSSATKNGGIEGLKEGEPRAIFTRK